MKKIILLLCLLLYANNANAQIIYEDWQYTYNVDYVIFPYPYREFFYSLKLMSKNNDYSYIVKITQNKYAKNMVISLIETFDKNNNHIHINPNEDNIKILLKNNSIIFADYILNNFVKCEKFNGIDMSCE